jgi:Flp pilus assembly protein TadG
MTWSNLIRRIRAIHEDDSGATLVEFTFAVIFFLVLLFAIIDFGRMAFSYVVAEKAMHMATRIAAVRPAACGGVPLTNASHASPPSPPPTYGTSCNAGGNICVATTVTCAGSAGNATANEVWALVSQRLPNTATVANLRFTYASDVDLGFLGGPYVPVVTVELTGLTFDFATPVGGLINLLNGTPGPGGSIPFPSMSVSLPGEDLAQGNAG